MHALSDRTFSVTQIPDLIRGRRSTAPITDDAPDDEQFRRFVALASHSPDHASLRRWRLVTLRGTDRVRLADALVAGFGDEPGSPQAGRTAEKALRAPLLVAIVFSPRAHVKVPEWEQLAATASMVTTLQLILFDAGYTAMWRSGPGVEFEPVRGLHGLSEDERLLGWLYVGGNTDPDGRGSTDDPDVADKVTALPA
jgi:nitroreductase